MLTQEHSLTNDTPAQAGEPASEKAATKHYVRQADDVFELSTRAYNRLLRTLARANPLPDLATYGKKLPAAVPITELGVLARTRAMTDTRLTTGRYGTRAELLTHIWALRLLSHLSDSAIARHVDISTTALGRILRSQEGRPLEQGPVQGFPARRFRGV